MWHGSKHLTFIKHSGKKFKMSIKIIFSIFFQKLKEMNLVLRDLKIPYNKNI